MRLTVMPIPLSLPAGALASVKVHHVTWTLITATKSATVGNQARLRTRVR